MMAKFSKYIPLLQQVEGGYQDAPDDPGNYNSLGELVGTNYGISARFYEQVIGRPPTVADMKAITKAQATSIFHQYFWNANNANKINNQSVANTVIDHQVNAGRGIRLAQKVLNEQFGKTLAVDGAMGPNTMAALNSVDPKEFVVVYNMARADYYRNLGGGFVSGWLARLSHFAYKHTPLITTGLVATALLGYIGYHILIKS